MIRKTMAVLGMTIGFAIATTACEKNAAEQRREAEQARIEADQKRAEAEREVAKAQANVQKELSDSEVALMKEKADFKVKMQKRIADIDEDLAGLKADAAKSTSATVKADYDKSIAELQTKRDALSAQLDRAETVSINEWEAFKVNVDRSVDDFEKTLKTASSKLKSTGRRVDQKVDPKTPPARPTTNPTDKPY